MRAGRSTVLTAPLLYNSSCWHPRIYTNGLLFRITVSGITESAFVSLLTVAILVANLMVIVTINSDKYTKFIHPQPRYLVTSLACNDLAIGLLVTPLAAFSALVHCWPYSEIVCQIQALLRAALPQQNAMILVFMAVDRYTCMLHPDKYHKHSSKKGCMLVLSLTLVGSLTAFGAAVIRRGGYFYNGNGLMACEPFYQRPSLRILAACLFYFPTTMALMYFYGSALHVDRLRHRQQINICAILVQPMLPNSARKNALDEASDRLASKELRQSIRTTRAMGAVALGFIVAVTPWTIQEVVTACTGTKMPPAVDFIITWIALSNSFWNPFIYWALNRKFRRISRNIIKTNIFRRKKYNSSVISSSCNVGHQESCCANRDMCFSTLQKDNEDIIEVDRQSLGSQDRGGFPPTPPPPPPYHRGDIQHCHSMRY
ncbi:trace amine-associated receptor 1 [Melanaphis sacchari]|uniref:Trace amine-associated receptor 1 n=1 Tax=Melanaphis sacchari TaxID=742174 RepID=A0A2H8TY23_9HEMI|nr:trace amine-associated receptor 1 [Melanaphis sacchari]XP_025201330.1 trace amine-associated receptor 1 [Melanaphis sacchari]